jgi:hypothetical protein
MDQMNFFMKRFFIPLFLIIWNSLPAQDLREHTGAYYCHMKKTSVFNLPPSETDVESGTPHSFNVQKYTLSLNLYSCYFSPFPKTFTASCLISIRVDSALNKIKLNAVNTSLLIDSVRNAGVSFTHSGNILTITLDRTYSPGEIAEVKIYYKHKDVSDGAFYLSSRIVSPKGQGNGFPAGINHLIKRFLN